MDNKYRKEETFEMDSKSISNVRNGKTHECFPVQARQNPYGFCRVAAVLRNRRRHVAQCAAPGDGNSGQLKRAGAPFQLSDTIPLGLCRVFYNSLSVPCQLLYNSLSIARKSGRFDKEV